MATNREPTLKELEFRIAELEKGFELASLKSGETGVGLVFVGILIIIAAATYAFVKTGQALISGTHLVFIIFILLGGLVLYFAFIFQREAKLLGQWEKQRIELGAGGNKRIRVRFQFAQEESMENINSLSSGLVFIFSILYLYSYREATVLAATWGAFELIDESVGKKFVWTGLLLRIIPAAMLVTFSKSLAYFEDRRFQ